MRMSASLPLWLGEVPDYEVVGGQMHVRIGEFALAMPINIFIVGCAKGKAAILKWDAEKQREAKVIPLRSEFIGRH
jgi:hypothetical protein